MLTSGGEPLRLTKDEGNKTVLSFSQDGTEIYFGQTLGDPEIWTIPTLGGEAKRLAAGRILTPSADGQSLYVLRPDGHIVRTTGTGVEQEDTFSAQYLSELSQSSNIGFGVHGDIKSYPDGNSLLLIWIELSGHATFQRLDLSSRRIETLGQLPDTSTRLSWAAPGKSVYVSRKLNGITNIWEYCLQDHSLRQQTFGTGPDRLPTADPNGKGVYFINGKNAGALRRKRDRWRFPASRHSTSSPRPSIGRFQDDRPTVTKRRELQVRAHGAGVAHNQGIFHAKSVCRRCIPLFCLPKLFFQKNLGTSRIVCNSL